MLRLVVWPRVADRGACEGTASVPRGSVTRGRRAGDDGDPGRGI